MLMADTSAEYGGKKATVAPTNQATLDAVNSSKASEVELDFVTYVHQQWLLTGEVPPKPDGLPDEVYKSDWVANALQERGITWPPVGTDSDPTLEWKHTGLGPVQLLVANALLDVADTRSIKKKLQDNGVSLAKYQSWLRDEKFNSYLKTRAEQLLGSHQHEARLALMDRVSRGDVKAIQFYLELTGEYVPDRGNNSAAQFADIQGLLVKVVEIISDEVDDPAIAARIADRFKTIMTARNIVGGLIAGEAEGITQPEIAAPRQMTPELIKLQNAGGMT